MIAGSEMFVQKCTECKYTSYIEDRGTNSMERGNGFALVRYIVYCNCVNTLRGRKGALLIHSLSSIRLFMNLQNLRDASAEWEIIDDVSIRQ